jgi:hypothetical protein
MAEFYLQTHSFLEYEWETLLQKASKQVNECIVRCDTDLACQSLCKKSLEDIKNFAENKENLYVKKGVEYCKTQCWDSKNLEECSQRCVKEYSVLLKDFKDSLLEHYYSAKIYNN